MNSTNFKSTVRYCKKVDYVVLFNLSNLLAELNFERLQLTGNVDHCVDNLFNLGSDVLTSIYYASEDDSDHFEDEESDLVNKICQLNKFDKLESPDKAEILDKIETISENSIPDLNKLSLDCKSDSNDFDRKSVENSTVFKSEENKSTNLNVSKHTLDDTLDDSSIKKIGTLNDMINVSNIHKSSTPAPQLVNHFNSYTAETFFISIKSVLLDNKRFHDHSFSELLMQLCDCVLHFYLFKKNLHYVNKNCAYEILFPILEQFKIIDFSFCIYLISSLHLCDILNDSLIRLNSTRLDSVYDMYFEVFDKVFPSQLCSTPFQFRLESSKINYKFTVKQIFRLNIMFSFSLIKSLFQIKNNSELVFKYLLMLRKCVDSIKKSTVSPCLIVCEYLRLYNFLIEKFLDDCIEVGSRSTYLYLQFNMNDDVGDNFYKSIAKFDSEHTVFHSCFEIIHSLFETREETIDSKSLSNLSGYKRLKLDYEQKRNEELVDIWMLLKKYFYKSDSLSLNQYEFVPSTDVVYEHTYIRDFLVECKKGYLFLAYCLIKSQNVDKTRDLFEKLDLQAFLHPKICLALAERSKTSSGPFYLNFLQELVTKFDKKTIKIYIQLHYNNFFLEKIGVVDITSKRELFNKVDSSNSSELRIELIKSVLADPMPTIGHLLTYSSSRNMALITCIADLFCNEFKPYCLHRLKKGKYSANFLTLLINDKIKCFNHQDLESLIYFVKFLTFFTEANKMESLIEIENLICLITQSDNLASPDLIEKKVYFLQMLVDLCENFNVEFKVINKNYSLFLLYLLQCVDIFWSKDVVSKMHTLKVLNFFKKKITSLSKTEQKFIKQRLYLENKIVLFYLSNFYDDCITELIDIDDLDQLLYSYAINGKVDDELDSYLRKKKFENGLTSSAKVLIKEFIIENQEVLTLEEHLNLFDFLIDYMMVSELIICYVSIGCKRKIRYTFEVVNYVLKMSLFKHESKLRQLFKKDEKVYLNQVFEIYQCLNECKKTIFQSFDKLKFDKLKYENLMIEMQKFIKNFKEDVTFDLKTPQ